jgi:hypothetical protein
MRAENVFIMADIPLLQERIGSVVLYPSPGRFDTHRGVKTRPLSKKLDGRLVSAMNLRPALKPVEPETSAFTKSLLTTKRFTESLPVTRPKTATSVFRILTLIRVRPEFPEEFDLEAEAASKLKYTPAFNHFWSGAGTMFNG